MDTDISRQASALLLLRTHLMNKDVSLEVETKEHNQSNKEAGPPPCPVTSGSSGGEESPPHLGPRSPTPSSSLLLSAPEGAANKGTTVGPGHAAQSCEDGTGVGLPAFLSSPFEDVDVASALRCPAGRAVIQHLGEGYRPAWPQGSEP